MIALVLAAALTAQTAFTREALHEDARVLESAYGTLHPGLLRYNTPDQITGHARDLDRELDETPTLQGAYLAFSRFTASIRCGHSYPNFFNQPDDVASALFEGRTRLPFFFVWLDREMVVTRNFSGDAALAPGSQVLSIDGTSTSIILERLLSMARADGSNDAKRIRELDVQGRDRYETFDIYYPMLFPLNSESVTLNVRSADNRLQTVQAHLLTSEQRKSESSKPSVNKAVPLWAFTMLSRRIAYFQMPTWEMYSSTWDWKTFLDRSFNTMAAQHASGLILDLRGNEGGNDEVGTALLAYIARTPVHPNSYKRLVRFRTVPSDLLPYLTTWDPSFKSLGASATTYDDRFFELPPSAELVVTPFRTPFLKKILVLVDGSNSSATFNFEAAVQRNGLGTLVGEPTGGNQRGINGGAFFFVHLPHTHIEVDLPLIGTFANETMPDAGLTPDVIVTTTRDDIARGIDSQLRVAQSMFKGTL